MNSLVSPPLREVEVAQLAENTFDVLILGGGINGAVSAAALAAAGARVALIDRADFASATSQESSNLIWGGIKYLETWEFGLVRKLCRARNRLLRFYPSAVKETRFYASHPRGFRHPLWKLLAGAFLYWALGGFFTRSPRLLSRKVMAHEEPLVDLESLDGGFEYSDSRLLDGDARFVWTFVRSALARGCVAVNYLEALNSKRESSVWVTQARDAVSGRELRIRSRVLVNACGPFADRVNSRHGIRTAHHHVFSKGIHLLVNQLTLNDRVLTFFADDGRLFFAIPFGSRTCIGTTDTLADRAEVEVTIEDRNFVLDNINKRLKLPRPLTRADIIAERCGVRPLVVNGERSNGTLDWVQLSRRHVIEVDAAARHITLFGGKLTDCLNVGEEVCAKVQRLGVALPRRDRVWFGEPEPEVRERFFEQATRAGIDSLPAPRDSEPLSSRLWRRYGTDAFEVIEAIRSDHRLAEPIIVDSQLRRCELLQAADREMVVRLEDFLRRRTDLAQVIRHEVLEQDPGVREACQLLFGEAGEAQRVEYFSRSAAA